MIKKISHLGMAVTNLEEAREFYRSVLKLESSEPIIGGDGTLQVSMVKVGEVLIELLEPIGNEGVMSKFLESAGRVFTISVMMWTTSMQRLHRSKSREWMSSESLSLEPKAKACSSTLEGLLAS